MLFVMFSDPVHGGSENDELAVVVKQLSDKFDKFKDMQLMENELLKSKVEGQKQMISMLQNDVKALDDRYGSVKKRVDRQDSLIDGINSLLTSHTAAIKGKTTFLITLLLH